MKNTFNRMKADYVPDAAFSPHQEPWIITRKVLPLHNLFFNSIFYEQ